MRLLHIAAERSSQSVVVGSTLRQGRVPSQQTPVAIAPQTCFEPSVLKSEMLPEAFFKTSTVGRDYFGATGCR